VSQFSNPDEEHAKLGAIVAIRIQHVEGFGVPGPHHAIEVRAHVREVAGFLSSLGASTAAANDVSRQHAGAGRDGAQQLHDGEVVVRGLAAHGVPDLAPVDVRRPQRLVEQPGAANAGAGARRLLLALERDAEVLRAHLLHEPPRLHRELEEKDGHAPGRLLHRQRHARPAVPEQRPRRARRAGDMAVVMAPRRAAAAAVARDDAREPARRGEDREGTEQRAHGADGAKRRPRGPAALPLVGRRRGEGDRRPGRARRSRRLRLVLGGPWQARRHRRGGLRRGAAQHVRRAS
jgi:hypothetical protein